MVVEIKLLLYEKNSIKVLNLAKGIFHYLHNIRIVKITHL